MSTFLIPRYRALSARMVLLTAAMVLICVSEISATPIDGPEPVIGVSIGHSEPIRSLALSGDGTFIATGTEKTVKLWDRASGRELRTFTGHEERITSVSISSDGSRLASADRAGRLIVWDTASGARFAEFHGQWIEEVDFAPGDHRLVLRTLNQDVLVLDEEASPSVAINEPDVLDARWSADGSNIILLTAARRVERYDAGSGEKVSEDALQFDQPIYEATLSSAGDWALVSSESEWDTGRARVMDTSSGAVIAEIAGSGERLSAVEISADGATAFLADLENVITVVDVQTAEAVNQFSAGSDGDYTSGIDPLVADNDSRTILFNVSKRLSLYDWDQEELRHLSRGGAQWVTAAVDGRGRLAAAGATDNDAIWLWDLKSGQLAQTVTGVFDSVSSLAVSPYAEYVLAAPSYGTARLVDVASGWDVREYEMPAPESEYVDTLTISPTDIAFLPGRQRVVLSFNGPASGSTSDAGQIALFDLRSEQLVTHLEDENNQIHRFALSPDGDRIATVSWYGSSQVNVWDMESGEIIRTFSFDPDTTEYDVASGYTTGRPTAVTFLEGGRKIAAGFDGWVVVWDVESGSLELAFQADTLTVIALHGLAEGSKLVTHGSEGLFKVWDVSTGALTDSFDGQVQATSVSFTATGRYAVVGAGDGALRVFDLAAGRLLTTSLATNSGEWITWTPEGYFTGSKWAMENLVYVVDGLETYNIDRLFDTFYRPDVVATKLAGQDIEPLVGNRRLSDAATPAPELEIELVEEGDVGDEGVARLRVTARDTGGGAQDLRFFHNGARLRAGTRGLTATDAAGSGPVGQPSSALQQTFTVELLDGENRFRAIAFSETRVESDPAEIILTYQAPQQVRPKLWLLAVGANEYRNSRYNLNYAVGDARSFAQAVERSGQRLFSDIETTVILNEDVTRERLLGAFASIAEEARPQDVFMFFYAGHGIALQSNQTDNTEFFFIMHDVVQMTSMEQVERLGISGPEFQELVTAIPARKQFHVLDACNAGAINTAFGFRGAGEEIALSRLSRATGSALIAASRDDQFAQEFEALGQGALTRAVLDGLSGAASEDDSEITVGELKSYVESAVPRLTAQHTGQAQFPTGFTFGQDFPVAVR